MGSADPRFENRSDATPNRGYPVFPSVSTSSSPTMRTLLTETGLRNEIPGHGEHVLLARLVVADGLGIHLGLRSRSTSHTRAYPSLFTLTNSRRYCRCVDRERDGLMRRRGGRERGWTKYTEIVREELGSGFSGSCALIRIAFLGTSRERQCGYIGERKNSCSGGGRDERGTEDQARAITWLGLGESLNVPFEPSSMKKLVFGAKERHAKSKEISI